MTDESFHARRPNSRVQEADRGLAGPNDPRSWCLVLRGPLGIGVR
jgi:hypothetical protein